MRPWYRYTIRNEDYPQATFITPFSKIWGFGAPVTLWLIIVSAAIWLTMIVTSVYKWLPLDSWWYNYFALTLNFVIQRHWYFHLVTSVFLHDGSDIMHLAVNMYLLWVFGPRVERSFGSKQYLIFYLATGVMGSIVSLFMRLWTGYGDTASLGASSSVFGMLIAYGFLFPNQILLLFFVIPVKVWKLVAIFLSSRGIFHHGQLDASDRSLCASWRSACRDNLDAGFDANQQKEIVA